MILYISLYSILINFFVGIERQPDAISDGRTLILENHFTKVVNSGTDVYGALKSSMWMSSLDLATGKYPENDQRPEQIPQRVYLDRSVSAPKGVTLYWDFPNIAAAYELSLHTKSELYKNAAKDYVTSYLSKCQSKNGIFLWGNHYYYDAFTDQCVKFKSDEKARPVDFTTERGELHEMRPHAPPWKILWNIDSIATERHITATISGHLVDMETGEFNRHADGERGQARRHPGELGRQRLADLRGVDRDGEKGASCQASTENRLRPAHRCGEVIASPHLSRHK
ncbi:MAG: hypothetical protein KAQ79_15915 [Cyclobacteriaceae bacterium]|nr:hypothetical protein [Cyclobacteriaceae bacterium]